MSEKAQLAAVVALLTASDVAAYAVDDVPSPLPRTYTEVHVMEKFSPAPYLGGQVGIRYWRVLTRAVGNTYGNAQRERERAAAALEGVLLLVGEATSTPIQRAMSDDPIGKDDALFSGVSEWSYAL